MPKLKDQLEQSLRTQYTFERELDGGGMARVFVVRERALGRSVVLKVLAPELAVSLNRERFEREILFTAPLQHPHIVPVLSAGDVNGLPYYTMPFVEGESLRDRLAGRRKLPLDDAVRILRDVADALAYAHARGIVHRDIKPDNILLAGGHALVTDFGIAKALSESQTEPRGATITHPGITVGTPAYMAPEQSLGDPVDQRADLYSFGCVAYELLIGEGPFPHPATHRLVTAHLTEAPTPVDQRRPDVPPELAALVMRCLEKAPERRPRSSREVLEMLDATSTGELRTLQRRFRRRQSWLFVAASAVLATALAASWYLAGWRGANLPLDEDVIAVVPFRVSAADPSLRALREGMIDLLDAKFVGAARVVDPRALLASWRRAGGTDSTDVDESAATKIAKRFGAGQLLLGSVTGGGGGSRLVLLTATLHDVRNGTHSQATVEGFQDSLPVLVDRLVAQLLALHAGQDAGSIASLGDMPIGALREYIEAQALARRGRFEDAIPRYRAAIARDSNFALAGMGLALTVGWLDDGDPNEGWRVAWRGRDRLSPADRAILEAWVGKEYPGWPSKSELRALAEHAVQVAPQKAEAWYALGDHLYHFGALQGIAHANEQSLTALNRAIALDSSYGLAAQHIPDLYVRTGDTTGARRAFAHVLALDSMSRYGTFSLWYAGVAERDRDRHDRARAALDQMISTSVSGDVAQSAIAAGMGYEDAEYLLTRLTSQGATAEERSEATLWLYQLAGARGRPKFAAQLFDGAAPPPPYALFAFLFEDGDSATAARARRRVSDTPCTTAELAAAYDLTARGDSAAAAARAHQTFDNDPTSECAIGAMTLDVLLATRNRRSDLADLATRLDSTLRAAPASPYLTLVAGNMIVARAFEQLGDPARALNAVRRRPMLFGPLLGWGRMLRDEGRYAALTGDREGAIRAFRLFVSLRADAEPLLQPELLRAQSELSRLQRETADR
jgi:serine/threonine-protein kinase